MPADSAAARVPRPKSSLPRQGCATVRSAIGDAESPSRCATTAPGAPQALRQLVTHWPREGWHKRLLNGHSGQRPAAVEGSRP
eukprot:9490737-Pyramimonas_sp.AAC.1